MPSEQTDVDGIPEYEGDGEHSCETCGMAAHECSVQDIPSARALENLPCWRAPGVRVRSPKDMVCVLGKISAWGAHCRGSRCYLWSNLGPEEETGIPGTCVIAQLLTQMVETGAREGVAMEKGGDS